MNIDDILTKAKSEGCVLLHKSVDPQFRAAVHELVVYGLLNETSKGTFRLTENGYEALANGIDNWKSSRKNTNLTNVNFISGNMTGDINQSSDSSKIIAYKKRTTAKSNVNKIIKWLLIILGAVASFATIYQVYKSYF